MIAMKMAIAMPAIPTDAKTFLVMIDALKRRSL